MSLFNRTEKNKSAEGQRQTSVWSKTLKMLAVYIFNMTTVWCREGNQISFTGLLELQQCHVCRDTGFFWYPRFKLVKALVRMDIMPIDTNM